MVNHKTKVVRKLAENNTTPIRAKIWPKNRPELDCLNEINTPPISNNRLAAEFIKLNAFDTPGGYICKHCKHFKRDHKVQTMERQKMFQNSSKSLERIINSNLIQSPYLKEHLFKKLNSPYDKNGRKLFTASNKIKMSIKNLPELDKAPRITKRTTVTGKTLAASSVKNEINESIDTTESNLEKNPVYKTRTYTKRWKYHTKCGQTQTDTQSNVNSVRLNKTRI